MPYDLLRPLLFRLPAEVAHELASRAITASLAAGFARERVRHHFEVRDSALGVTRWGIHFPSPVGLAAGFDKAGTLFNALTTFGFGAIEIGTVTAQPQPGNPRPRLFRLSEDEALLNRMGFNNPGADAVAARLARTRIEPVLGINIGKSKAAPLERATKDYLYSLERLERFADYVVVNVSSPNTPGLRTLQDAVPLRELLRTLTDRTGQLAAARGATPRPILLKIAPDLADEGIDQAVDIAREQGASGIVAVNTTIARSGLRTAAPRVDAMGAGGISGAPVRERARAVVARIYRRTCGELPIIGVGGIFTAEDAWACIRAGASVVQLYTGFVYGGPATVRRINLGLLERMRRDGFDTLEEAIGSDHRLANRGTHG